MSEMNDAHKLRFLVSVHCEVQAAFNLGQMDYSFGILRISKEENKAEHHLKTCLSKETN